MLLIIQVASCKVNVAQNEIPVSNQGLKLRELENSNAFGNLPALFPKDHVNPYAHIDQLQFQEIKSTVRENIATANDVDLKSSYKNVAIVEEELLKDVNANQTTILQFGYSNFARINQQGGNFNTAKIIQYSNSNIANIVQNGSSNTANITQR